MVLVVVMLLDQNQIMEVPVLVDKALAVSEVEMLVDKVLAALEVEMQVDKDQAVSLVETPVVKDLVASVVEVPEAKGLVVSLAETLVVKVLAVLEVEMQEVKGLAISLGAMLVDKDLVILETALDQETRQLVMPMMALTKVVIYLLFLVSLEQTTLYYLKYQKLHSLATKNYQDIMLIPRLDAKYSTYVLITLSTISYVLTERFSTNSTSYVFGGISLIVLQPKVFIA